MASSRGRAGTRLPDRLLAVRRHTLSRPYRAWFVCSISLYPAINRWATLSRPYRDEVSVGTHKFGHIEHKDWHSVISTTKTLWHGHDVPERLEEFGQIQSIKISVRLVVASGDAPALLRYRPETFGQIPLLVELLVVFQYLKKIIHTAPQGGSHHRNLNHHGSILS